MEKKIKESDVEKEVNPVDLLFDPNNRENITLYNEKDEPVEFEQVAVIPLEDSVYAILQPVQKMEGLGDDEAFAFEVIEDEENGDTLKLVEDDAVIDKIFDEYKKLFDSQSDK